MKSTRHRISQARRAGTVFAALSLVLFSLTRLAYAGPLEQTTCVPLDLDALPGGKILTRYGDITFTVQQGAAAQVILYPSSPPNNANWPEADLNRMNAGNVIVFPEAVEDENADGIADPVGDSSAGGRLRINFGAPRLIQTLTFGDDENGGQSKVQLYDAAGLLATFTSPVTGNGTVVTQAVNVDNVTRLVWTTTTTTNLKFTSACSTAAPTLTLTSTSTSPVTTTPTVSVTNTATARRTRAATRTPTPTNTVLTTFTPSPSPTETLTPSRTSTRRATRTLTPSRTNTPRRPTRTPTATAPNNPTLTQTATVGNTATATTTPTTTSTPRRATRTPTATAPNTATATNTPTTTGTSTPTISPTASSTPKPTDTPLAGSDKDRALAFLNGIRKQAGLAAVVEDATLSDGANKHANYLVLNASDVAQTGDYHSEDPAKPGYTKEGDDVAGNSDIDPTCFGSWEVPMRNWLNGPLHAIPLLSPDLDKVGLGHVEKFEGGFCDAAYVLGFHFTFPPATINQPIYYPPPNGTHLFLAYDGAEGDAPYAQCGGTYSGPGIFLKDAASIRPGDVNQHLFSQGDTAVSGNNCMGVFFDMIYVMPSARLEPGKKYTVSITTSRNTYTWSFYAPGQ